MPGWSDPNHRLDAERLAELFREVDWQLGLFRAPGSPPITLIGKLHPSTTPSWGTLRCRASALNLGRLVGATSRIRLDSTIEEIERQTGRRTNALRAFPPSDPGFHKVFGVREGAESLFANLKTPLVNRRIPCAGRDRFRLELLGSQGIAVIRALIAWHERAGGDVSAFFGQRCPLPRDGPHDCA